MQERNPSPVPFLIFSALIGLLLGSWWIGLLVGIGMTILPGVSVLALFIQNILLIVLERVIMIVGFPFYLAYSAIRRLVVGRPDASDDGNAAPWR